MYLSYQNNKIVGYTKQPQDLVLYNLDRVEETDKEYVLVGDEYVLYDEEQKAKELAEAKEAKRNEANLKAKEYLESGKALFELEPDKHIEATDGNIGKFDAHITAFNAGAFEVAPWTTKEDTKIELNLELASKILLGLMQEQARVWVEKAQYFLNLIDQAETVEDVNNIKIDYNIDI